MFYLPLSLFIFISLLLHNFIIFPPPQFFYFSPLNVFISSSTILLFTSSFLNSLLLHNVNLSQPLPHSWIPSASIFVIFPLVLFYFPPPPQFLLFSLRLLHLLIYSIYFSIHKYIDLISTLDSIFFKTASWIVKLYTTTNHISFFSLHHHHISIVFPPPPYFYCFPSKRP